MAGPSDFFKKNDAFRKHPMLTNQLRIAFPGLGIAVAAFGVYLFVEGMSSKLSKSKAEH